jgi:hypothetical protein
MLLKRHFRTIFLAVAILFEVMLIFASTLYLEPASMSFILVVFAGILSIVMIVVKVREQDRISYEE